MSQVLSNLAVEVFKQKAVVSTIKDRLSAENKKLEELETSALTALIASEMQSFKMAGYGTVYLKERTSVRVPKLQSDREAFFGYLKDRGIFDELITVNSMTLNSFYAEELEKAVAEGNDKFKIPGIGDATITQELGTRKS